jgi:hypothetical protein
MNWNSSTQEALSKCLSNGITISFQYLGSVEMPVNLHHSPYTISHFSLRNRIPALSWARGWPLGYRVSPSCLQLEANGMWKQVACTTSGSSPSHWAMEAVAFKAFLDWEGLSPHTEMPVWAHGFEPPPAQIKTCFTLDFYKREESVSILVKALNLSVWLKSHTRLVHY